MKFQAHCSIAFLTGLLGWNLAATSAQAMCANPLKDSRFEEQKIGRILPPWVAEGRAGIDINQGYSYEGRNNAWLRNTSGWNALRQKVRLVPNRNYVIRAYVRTSGNVQDGYFGVRHGNQAVLAEVKFGPQAQYKQLTVRFRTGDATEYNIFAGFWAPGADAWVQVDNLSLEGSSDCPDTE
ncbi:hypothetical protein [Alkalinema sp. FACHB-956]|uniref:hypothetical protein n=1 Tax=Alkalinema sp. FACHB-956 TaxID=2692768 RepID=UPI00168A11D3|nr:hypothetical protein [Alkalinema sp. FACHB-956]MBD2325783.1 hypothetical protein [Alkalinema sp. FACHB-956]